MGEFQSQGVVDMLEKLHDKFEDEESNARHAYEMLIQDLTAQIETATEDREAKAQEKARSVCIRFSAGCISLFSAELSPWYFLQACADRSDRYSLGLQLRSRRRLRFGGFCPPFSQPSSSSLRGAAQQAGLQAGLEVIYSQQVVLRAVQLQRV